MRLLSTSTLRLESESFEPEDQCTKYAILSHRWQEGEEITFQELNDQSASNKRGHAKIEGFCQLARSNDIKYGWIDTCCINKDSQTELNEAINSMYRWYAKAEVCITYLYDVGSGYKSIEESEWFERGWTLQELIAPSCVKFYDRDWNCLGDKESLRQTLSVVTGIPEKVLADPQNLSSCSVAQRMSWASRRKTKKKEDEAYSLFGLFGISLPTNYGERENAFERLQEEIIRKFSDETIFAWKIPQGKKRTGLLAPSPSVFGNCGSIVSVQNPKLITSDNLGLSTDLPLVSYGYGTYLALLNARDIDSTTKRCAILLAKVQGEDQYARVTDSQGLSLFRMENLSAYKVKSIRVRQNPNKPTNIFPGFWLRTIEPPGYNECELATLSNAECTESDRLIVPETAYVGGVTAGTVYLLPKTGTNGSSWSRIGCLKLGFDDQLRPWCMLTYRPALEILSKKLQQVQRDGVDSPVRRELLSADWIRNPRGEEPNVSQGWPSGMYIMAGKQDRTKVSAINLEVSISWVRDPAPLLKGNEEDGPQYVWAVDMVASETSRVSPENRRHIHTCLLCGYSILSLPILLMGCGKCWLDETKEWRDTGQI